MAETEESVTAPVAEVTESKAPETPEALDEEADDEDEDDDFVEDDEEEGISEEEKEETAHKIEKFVRDEIPSLREFIVSDWNESGKYKSVLNPDPEKPLLFENDEEKEAFIPFCEERLHRVPLGYSGECGPTEELLCLAIDRLNGHAWESCMCFGDCYVISADGSPTISYCEGSDNLLGHWGISYGAVAEEIRDAPLVKGDTIYWF